MDAIRRHFGIKKVGHCGTLDPNATGLLIIVLGRGTKLSERLMSDELLRDEQRGRGQDAQVGFGREGMLAAGAEHLALEQGGVDRERRRRDRGDAWPAGQRLGREQRDGKQEQHRDAVWIEKDAEGQRGDTPVEHEQGQRRGQGERNCRAPGPRSEHEDCCGRAQHEGRVVQHARNRAEGSGLAQESPRPGDPFGRERRAEPREVRCAEERCGARRGEQRGDAAPKLGAEQQCGAQDGQSGAMTLTGWVRRAPAEKSAQAAASRQLLDRSTSAAAANAGSAKAIPSAFGAPPQVQKYRGDRAARTAATPTARPAAAPPFQRDTAAAKPTRTSAYDRACPTSPASRQPSPPSRAISAVVVGCPTG